MKSKQIDTRRGVGVEVLPESLGGDVIEIRSTSNPKKIYRVDVVNGRCSCPAWIFQRGKRKPCKHLEAMGLQSMAKNENPSLDPFIEE